MKRWMAGLLSVMILFSGGLCLAETAEPMENADIQETVVSVEGETLGTLSENLRLLIDLSQSEEVLALLGIEEVKTVTSEIIWRVLVWLFQNRPVTMKILAELGVGESDRRCIEKLWDSAERIGNTLEEISKTEDGRQLQAEAAAVKNDPDLQESWENFQELTTSEDLVLVLDSLNKAINSEITEKKNADGTLTKEAMERQMDQSSFTGKLIFEALSILEQSEWARESVPKLLKNENLWRFLTHMSGGNKELDHVLRDEFALIAADPDMNVFFKQTLTEAQALSKALKGMETDNSKKTGEEVAP